MAIDAHSTTAPADHRALLRTHGAPRRVLGKRGILSQVAKVTPDLPPSFIDAVPVPTPALTAETVAMLDAIPPELPLAQLSSLVAPSLRRRHLNESQRAMAAAKLANMKEGRPTSNGQATDLSAETETVGIPTVSVSQGEAAKLLNISRSTVIEAKKVLNEGTAGDVRQGGAGGVCATVARTAAADMPCGAACGDIPTTDLAQALHMRRALEGALDHGTALLAALGLPRLMEPGFVPLDPSAIGDALDTAIATLDAIDVAGVDLEDDGTAEPWLGWIDGKPVLSDSHDDREAEDDDEPTLGAPERHPSCYQFALCDATSSQEHWADGSARYDEAEVVNEDGTDLDAGELDEADLEPSLGAPEVAFGRHEPFRVDQTHWAGGGLSDLELNDVDKPADLDGLHEQFACTGLVPALDWTAGGYVG